MVCSPPSGNTGTKSNILHVGICVPRETLPPVEQPVADRENGRYKPALPGRSRFAPVKQLAGPPQAPSARKVAAHGGTARQFAGCLRGTARRAAAGPSARKVAVHGGTARQLAGSAPRLPPRRPQLRQPSPHERPQLRPQLPGAVAAARRRGRGCSCVGGRSTRAPLGRRCCPGRRRRRCRRRTPRCRAPRARTPGPRRRQRSVQLLHSAGYSRPVSPAADCGLIGAPPPERLPSDPRSGRCSRGR